jgi:hypothetical protein
LRCSWRSETLGKSAQTVGIELNIKASDTWNFFQAKTIRQTPLRTAAEAMALQVASVPDEAGKAADQTDRDLARPLRVMNPIRRRDGRKLARAGGAV